MHSGSKKGTQICFPFPSKSPGKWIPSTFPNGAPMERNTCLQGIFTSLISHFIFHSESLVREPPPCSQTGSPWAAILHHQSHCSTFHTFIHSCMSVIVPRKEHSYIHMGEKHEVTVQRAPRRQKAYIQWGAAWFPKGIITILLSLLQWSHKYKTGVPTANWWYLVNIKMKHINTLQHKINRTYNIASIFFNFFKSVMKPYKLFMLSNYKELWFLKFW